MYVWECCIIDHSNKNWGWLTNCMSWIMAWLYDYENVHCGFDWGLLIGSGVIIWHTNMDGIEFHFWWTKFDLVPCTDIVTIWVYVLWEGWWPIIYVYILECEVVCCS